MSREPVIEIVRQPKRRGRPQASEPGSTVCCWLPASEHDRIVKLAEKRGESISSTVRLLLMTKWRTK